MIYNNNTLKSAHRRGFLTTPPFLTQEGKGRQLACGGERDLETGDGSAGGGEEEDGMRTEKKRGESEKWAGKGRRSKRAQTRERKRGERERELEQRPGTVPAAGAPSTKSPPSPRTCPSPSPHCPHNCRSRFLHSRPLTSSPTSTRLLLQQPPSRHTQMMLPPADTCRGA